jgi:hypothetical protein
LVQPGNEWQFENTFPYLDGLGNFFKSDSVVAVLWQNNDSVKAIVKRYAYTYVFRNGPPKVFQSTNFDTLVYDKIKNFPLENIGIVNSIAVRNPIIEGLSKHPQYNGEWLNYIIADSFSNNNEIKINYVFNTKGIGLDSSLKCYEVDSLNLYDGCIGTQTSFYKFGIIGYSQFGEIFAANTGKCQQYSYYSLRYLKTQNYNYQFKNSLLPAINHLKSKISCYPNPASTKLNFTGDEHFIKSIAIYNLNNQLLHQQNHTNPINIENLKPNIYFIKYSSHNGDIKIEKFIKK